jgi:spore coat polysaccharide biosynthesis protein SpsF
MRYTEQFWSGEFGDEYTNRSPGNLQANIAFFSRILSKTHSVESIVELGCGSGLNLRAIDILAPNMDLWGVEINESAADRVPVGQVIRGSFLDVPIPSCDLAFTKGVLIHVNPGDLPHAYSVLYGVSTRYILVAEYFNPTLVEVEYRGHSGRLWKTDFAKEMMQMYADLRLVDYGFVWKQDQFPQDDLTWFLLEKK